MPDLDSYASADIRIGWFDTNRIRYISLSRRKSSVVRKLDAVGHRPALTDSQRANKPGYDIPIVAAAVGDIIDGVNPGFVGVVCNNAVICLGGPGVAVVDSIADVVTGSTRAGVKISPQFFDGEHREEQVGDLLAD